MSRHYQETLIEFRRSANKGAVRGLVVYVYAGTIEDRIREIREMFGLGPEWEIIGMDVP